MDANAVPARRRPDRVHSVERTFELLEAVIEFGGTARLSRLAMRLGLPTATTHRIVRTLVDLDYLYQLPSREYSLGRRLSRLGEHVRQHDRRMATMNTGTG